MDNPIVPPVVKPSAKLTPTTKKVTLDEGEDYAVVCTGNSPNITWRHSNGVPVSQYPK